jgi:Domain of unknown function (DUF1844)
MAELQTHTEAGEMTQIFIEFVMMQAQNAALFMGQIPNPRGGQPEVNLPLAKMFIDQLAVIGAKTQGNLNADEVRVLDSALTQLEAAFMEVANTVGHDLGEAPAAAAVPASSAPSAPAPEAKPEPLIVPPNASPAPAVEEESRKRFTKSYGA